MKRKIINITQAVLVLLVLHTFFFIDSAAAASCTPTIGSGGLSSAVFEITPWYKYLPGDDDNPSQKCRPVFPEQEPGVPDIPKVVVLILIAVLELLMRISGLIAAGYVIYGAVQYITSQGEPEGITNAKNTITNALIGFAVVMLSIVITQFLGRALN